MKPLHDLDNIKASEELKSKTLHAVIQQSHHKKTYVIPSVIGAFICLLLFFITQYSLNETSIPIDSNEIYAYVSVDINPSMEFQLDKYNKVVNIVSYNEDARLLLEDNEFKGLSVQQTLESLLQYDVIQDYMTSGYLQVSVYSDDDGKTIELEEAINNTLSKQLDKTQYNCVCASRENHQEANEHHMSFGKYAVIEQILELDKKYTIEDLQMKSMMELKTIYEALSGESFQQNTHKNENGKRHGRGHHK